MLIQQTVSNLTFCQKKKFFVFETINDDLGTTRNNSPNSEHDLRPYHTTRNKENNHQSYEKQNIYTLPNIVYSKRLVQTDPFILKIQCIDERETDLNYSDSMASAGSVLFKNISKAQSFLNLFTNACVIQLEIDNSRMILSMNDVDTLFYPGYFSFLCVFGPQAHFVLRTFQASGLFLPVFVIFVYFL